MPIAMATNEDADMKSEGEAPHEKEPDADSASDSGSDLPELPEGVCGLCEQEFGAQDEDTFGTQPSNIVHCDIDRPCQPCLLEARGSKTGPFANADYFCCPSCGSTSFVS